MLPLGISVFKCEVLEVYKTYTQDKYAVIKNCETGELFITTEFRDWNWATPEKGTIGYIEVEFAKAGVSEFYDKGNGCMSVWKNTYIAFRKFIPETGELKDEIIM
jgi:hypothetical protein